MKVFVTGVCGQLGHDVALELARRGHEVIGSDLAPESVMPADQTPVACAAYHTLDVTDSEAVSRTLAAVQPDAVIHCAAWTAVDAAEMPENMPRVRAVNVDGTRNIAQACRNVGCKMLYLSTDYVFDGQSTEPWKPECRDFAPVNVYGQTKLEGELAVADALEEFFIVRIAWAFGLRGKNFVRTTLQLAEKNDSIRVVNDQIGTPTYTLDLARLLVDMIETDKYGYYHVTNEGDYISWADFAEEVFRQAGLPTRVIPVTTAEYGLSRAARPFNSRFDRSKLLAEGFTPLPDWRDALARYLDELKRTP